MTDTTTTTIEAPKGRDRPTQRIVDALVAHGPLVEGQPWDAELNAEQRARALTAPAGMRGKVAATFVLTGEGSAAQVKAAKAAREKTEGTQAKTAASTGPRPGSAMADAVTVLKSSGCPMTPVEIYQAGVEMGLFKSMKGKTPINTLAAQLSTALKNGRVVDRPEKGKFVLKAEAVVA